MNEKKFYEIHTSLWQEINEGHIWIKDTELKKELEARRHIVRVGLSHKKVYCEALYAGERDIKRFKEHLNSAGDLEKDNLIFINRWYRMRLGIEDLRPKPLTICLRSAVSSFSWPLLACFQHPQVVVRVATVLAMIGFGLGLIGVGLSLIGIQEVCSLGSVFGWVFVALGLGVCVFGIALPCVKRD